MKNIGKFREELRKVVDSQETVEVICQMIVRYEAQEEKWRRECQKEGIVRAKEAGITFGRPRKQVPDNFEAIAESFLDKKMSSETAAKACGVGLSTFYRRITDYKLRKGVKEDEGENKDKRRRKREE